MSRNVRVTEQRGNRLRGKLLRGSSVVALVTAIGLSHAHAQSLSQLKAVVGVNNEVTSRLLKNPNINQEAAEAAGMSAATARALHYQAQVAQALALAQQAQNAARQAVLGTTGNVPNGLVIGGLQEVPNPLPAAQDPTGTSTWQGAAQPTETKSGNNVTVTIKQTQQRAILSWETFNVGQNTTVNFDQEFKGVAEKSWVALNRVVGDSTSPAEILGSIKAQGTVLIIDQNGILFGGASQINVNALIASTLEIGHPLDPDNGYVPLTIKDRNDYFLEYGLLGYADQANTNEQSETFTFSTTAMCPAQGTCNQGSVIYDTTEGAIQVNAGASITANNGGYILLTGPQIVNSGEITAPLGQVSLEAGQLVTLLRSTGALGSTTPDIRGFALTSYNNVSIASGDYVENTAEGIISSPQGYASLESNEFGGVINDGILEATTSVSRNGFVQLDAGDVQLGAGSTIAIGPDPTAETIPQDPVSLTDFKPSKVVIGDDQSRVEIQRDAMIYAPGGNVTVGISAGADTYNDAGENDTLSRIFMDSDAVIDVAGLPDVTVSASLNSIAIKPVTQNSLQDDSNAIKDSFLNGATVYVDPRLSGVRSDGVAWVGSPLIPAESYYQQVGVDVRQLMTAGGNVTLGVQSYANTSPDLASDVTIKSGAVIDLDGGWVTYQAGWVKTTELIDASGNIVNIGQADPNDTYIGIYNGFTSVQSRWGVEQTWSDPLLTQGQYEPAYTEGRDAGSLTLKSSVVVLDGTVYAHAYPGPMQLQDAQVGTGKSSVYGDGRNVQAAPSQLPVGGFLFVQALADDAQDPTAVYDGGGDIDIVNQADYQALPSNFEYGQSISIVNGQLVIPTRAQTSYLPPDRLETITLSADAISNMGLNDIALATSGNIDVEQGADLTLTPGGAFQAISGRAITIDGAVSVPSGRINLETTSIYGSGDPTAGGSVFVQETAQLGSFDITVNGSLSARGLWTNDYGAAPGQELGNAYTSGGSITLNAAPSVLLYTEVNNGDNGPQVNTDISGSILLNRGSLLDVSGGGYVSPVGAVDLAETGGNVSLIDETSYFQTGNNNSVQQSAITGFRVDGIQVNDTNYLPSNPGSINARISIAPGTIEGYGFGGGGTFTLDTPEISFGDGVAATGTELPLDFFSKSGFANYDLTAYETNFSYNTFYNPDTGTSYGGYNAVLATDVLTVGAGQTLGLTQTYLALDLNNPARAQAQMAALQSLPTGGDIYSIIKPNIPSDAWDRKAVNLTLGGLIELNIAKGGRLVDEAGGVLTVSQLDNEGTIRIPGGTINQTEVLPSIFGSEGLGVYSLASVFTMNPDGTINEDATDFAAENYGICGNGSCTNEQVAVSYDIYLLGTLGQGVGIHLGTGSVTDLSGISIRDPRATAPGQRNFITGKLYSGGTLESQPNYLETAPIFGEVPGFSVYGADAATGSNNDPPAYRMPELVVADSGSMLNLSGASDVYDVLGADGTYVPTREWSNGGTLDLASGGTITGADILAQGGASQALGGTLEMLDPVFYQDDPSTPTANAVSEQQIAAAGFSTFVAQGKITSSGDATITLDRAFFLTSVPYDGQTDPDGNDIYVPTIGSGGALTIEAPYIGLDSVVQTIQTPPSGQPEANSVTLKADDIDIMGAVLFDDSVGNVTLDASGDVRLIGVQPGDITLGIQGTGAVADTLVGQLAVSGNLAINSAQVYPTTGSTFTVTSAATDGTISFGRTTQSTPDTPYSAGADLTIQAANIVLGGVIRVPIGTLTIGSDQATAFAPQTNSVTALSGSITSVSANGLSIPYGTTTDQAEWFFAPTNSSELTAPPAAALNFGGNSVTLNSGATVDLSGGGDLYAYEFIPGTGGSRDVLDYNNPNEFSGNGGYLYPGAEQVYAIVPGLSSATVAPYDPIYSANYGNLYSAPAVGQSVYLTGGQGIAAGWYTLLPAQYAMLPGGMRIVEDENDSQIATGTSDRLTDGTVLMSGYYGVAGTDTRSSTPVAFEVQSQNVFGQYSQIALTSADTFFAQLAAKNEQTVPRLPLDAARLVLAPTEDLLADATFLTTPAQGGRGSEADISGADFDIVSTLGAPEEGVIQITAGTLDDLNASSLLIGGVRTDNSDGTTSIDVTAQSITVANDSAHPLTAPEVILAVNGSGSSITLDDGATIIAKGNPDIPLTGNYIIDSSGQAALLRVSNGPQRLAAIENVTNQNIQLNAVTVGNADLTGNSVLLDSSGNLSVASGADIEAGALALGASQVTFTSNGQGLLGLVITPQLQALFGNASQLTILTPDTIAFASGTYDFGNITFDTPGLSLLNGNAVTLNADTLTLMNGSSAGAECGQAGAPACGNGDLLIDAAQIDFGWGTVNTYGFGQSVVLSAPKGMFMLGQGTFDAGPAALTLQTPYVGDLGSTPVPGVNEVIPSLSLTTAGTVTIDNPTGASAPDVQGVPGSSLTIAGYSISVDDSELRATAGTLTLNSQTGIDILGDAVIETPSYAKTFGDSADPVSVSAPGGTLSLIAQNGNIDAASGTTISVGGNSGTAGTLSLSANDGSFDFNGTIDASAPDGGGSLVLSTGGSFDLAAFSNGFAKDFSGTIDITSGSGNLILPGGDELKAQNVVLDAEGGLVDIGGTIDVSGVNGGTVDLYGIQGVTLESTALIDAHADGYAKLDPRQAYGGTVDIGTDQNGVIDVKSGATIDVAALRTMARLVPMTMNGTTYYIYVPGDVGGTVNFRLPVIDGQNGETVNMTYAGNIEGASAIDLVGFERWNLADVADDPNFVGVTINGDGQAVLDVSAVAGQGQVNFLSCAVVGNKCTAPAGTPVNFIQNFNISSDYGNLGGLASQRNFNARPGVELDYSGDIVLNSNWNLGAGTVNIPAAVRAGLMLPVVPGCLSDCQYYVIPGDEGEVFSKYTSLTYRVGGSVLGEPAVLTLRAGGNLDINYSITDGFFQFGDQNDNNYMQAQLGGGNQYWQPYLTAQCEVYADCSQLVDWQSGLSYKDASNYVGLFLPKSFAGQSFLDNPVPYNPDANSPSADGGNGDITNSDVLGSMQVFPLVTTAHGTAYAQSTSYQFVAGADLNGFGGDPSVNPLRTVAGTDDSVVVDGIYSFSYNGGAAGTSNYTNQLDFQVGNAYLSADAWYMAFLTEYPDADANSYTFVNYASAPAAVQLLIDNSTAFGQFMQQYQGDYTTITKGSEVTGIETTLNLANLFMVDVIEPNFGGPSGIISNYTPPSEHPNGNTATAYYTSLVRTGTGFIDMAASGDINLENGSTPTEEQLNTGDYLQLGGSPVYTVGHIADVVQQTVVDELTGQTFTIDPNGYDLTDNLFSQPLQGGYEYGDSGGKTNAGYADIMITNPVYLTGGGSISLTAGNDVLSRLDAYGDAEIADEYNNANIFYSWIGSSDQTWRVGTIGDVINALINPQLFTEGVGALGGGDITINAGHNIVDLTVADDTSVTTASVTGQGLPTLGIWQFGGGNVSIAAGNDILGGRFDIGEGTADITAGSDIAALGNPVQIFWNNNVSYTIPDTLRLRLTDATISVSANGPVDLAGIGALGVYSEGGASQDEENLDAHGFYTSIAGVSVLSDASVEIDNQTPIVRFVAATQPYDFSILTNADTATNGVSSAVYPGSLSVASLTGSLDIVGTYPTTALSNLAQADEVILYPSPVGQLDLYAGANISPMTLDMEDGDPGLLPGIFSNFAFNPSNGEITGRTFNFPGVLPNTDEATRQTFHNSTPTHLNDPYPVRIDAGGDILDMIVSVPKQARVWAGQDIINMMFFGQNLLASDITRIVAGRDITATTELVAPYYYNNLGELALGAPEAAVEGNDFILGGPGSFFLEAGRDMGPFLNSADTNGLVSGGGTATVSQSFPGGIIAVGNDWNPFLAPTSANLYVMFGIANGADYTALRNYYLDPANFANQPGYLFQQVTTPSGNTEPDRSEPIYASILVKWVKQNAAAALQKAYGTTNVTYQQAYDVFVNLPELDQQIFLLDNVYFNELAQTSVPTGASYQNYSRGYIAVNLLFPASLGYTANNLGGGTNGANQLVETGDLDLRLSTIETTWGGSIYILGPGGRALIGSTVATSSQAALHTEVGGQLYEGVPITPNGDEIAELNLPDGVPYPSTISDIPAGYEGVLTLRGGSIDTFTDEDFLLNQSRLFTEEGGNIIMWSSNGSLNAGQGPQTSSNFPPIVVQTDDDLYSYVDSSGGVTGAGIAAFQPAPGVAAPDVFLIAPRGTVDAGAAGVRVAGNLFVAAFQVANSSNFTVSGTTVGVPGSAAVNVAAETSGSTAAAAASQMAQAVSGTSNSNGTEESVITVDVMGYAGGGDNSGDEETRKRKH